MQRRPRADGAASATEVRAAMGELVPVIRDLRSSFRVITDEISVTLGAARGTITGVDAEVGMLARRLAATSAEIEGLVAEARPGMRDFSNSGLYEVTQFLMEARELIGSLDRVVFRPVGETLLDDSSIQRFRSGYRNQFGAEVAADPVYDAVSAGQRHGGGVPPSSGNAAEVIVINDPPNSMLACGSRILLRNSTCRIPNAEP